LNQAESETKGVRKSSNNGNPSPEILVRGIRRVDLITEMRLEWKKRARERERRDSLASRAQQQQQQQQHRIKKERKGEREKDGVSNQEI